MAQRPRAPEKAPAGSGRPPVTPSDAAPAAPPRELRRRPETAPARLVAVTGYGRDEDRQLSREAGFEQHLVKPVSPEVLREVLTAFAPS